MMPDEELWNVAIWKSPWPPFVNVGNDTAGMLGEGEGRVKNLWPGGKGVSWRDEWVELETGHSLLQARDTH